MARIVLGIGTSHGPMLSTPPEQWDARVPADHANPQHFFRGKSYDFRQLVAARKSENLGAEISVDIWRRRRSACDAATAELARVFQEAKPDVAVIVGNDQMELFGERSMPAITVFRGATMDNIPFGPEQLAKLPPGIAISERGHCPPSRVQYKGVPELGGHIIRSLIAEEFDVAQSTELPVGPMGTNSVPHAYGFVYRNIMKDDVIPNVMVILNTFYPPNQPTAKRCFNLGRALKRAIESWPEDARVALIASGGLTHFVIDEALDRHVLDGMQNRDAASLTSLSENLFQSGTSEIKNWLPVAGAMMDLGYDMTLVDYVPCYRTEAGTGNAMGFVYWK
jgi:3-O-methylgallate 3,4-dioxygenase